MSERKKEAMMLLASNLEAISRWPSLYYIKYVRSTHANYCYVVGENLSAFKLTLNKSYKLKSKNDQCMIYLPGKFQIPLVL